MKSFLIVFLVTTIIVVLYYLLKSLVIVGFLTLIGICLYFWIHGPRIWNMEYGKKKKQYLHVDVFSEFFFFVFFLKFFFFFFFDIQNYKNVTFKTFKMYTLLIIKWNFSGFWIWKTWSWGKQNCGYLNYWPSTLMHHKNDLINTPI